MTDAIWKACLDLAALVLIWAGTAAISLGGVPALIGNPVVFGKQEVTFTGQETIFGHTSASRAAVRRYRAWAVPGFIAITVGAVWQALGPISVLLPDAQVLAVFKPR